VNINSNTITISLSADQCKSLIKLLDIAVDVDMTTRDAVPKDTQEFLYGLYRELHNTLYAPELE